MVHDLHNARTAKAPIPSTAPCMPTPVGAAKLSELAAAADELLAAAFVAVPVVFAAVAPLEEEEPVAEALQKLPSGVAVYVMLLAAKAELQICSEASATSVRP